MFSGIMLNRPDVHNTFEHHGVVLLDPNSTATDKVVIADYRYQRSPIKNLHFHHTASVFPNNLSILKTSDFINYPLTTPANTPFAIDQGLIIERYYFRADPYCLMLLLVRYRYINGHVSDFFNLPALNDLRSRNKQRVVTETGLRMLADYLQVRYHHTSRQTMFRLTDSHKLIPTQTLSQMLQHIGIVVGEILNLDNIPSNSLVNWENHFNYIRDSVSGVSAPGFGNVLDPVSISHADQHWMSTFLVTNQTSRQEIDNTPCLSLLAPLRSLSNQAPVAKFLVLTNHEAFTDIATDIIKLPLTDFVFSAKFSPRYHLLTTLNNPVNRYAFLYTNRLDDGHQTLIKIAKRALEHVAVIINDPTLVHEQDSTIEITKTFMDEALIVFRQVDRVMCIYMDLVLGSFFNYSVCDDVLWGDTRDVSRWI